MDSQRYFNTRIYSTILQFTVMVGTDNYFILLTKILESCLCIRDWEFDIGTNIIGFRESEERSFLNTLYDFAVRQK